MIELDSQPQYWEYSIEVKLEERCGQAEESLREDWDRICSIWDLAPVCMRELGWIWHHLLVNYSRGMQYSQAVSVRMHRWLTQLLKKNLFCLSTTMFHSEIDYSVFVVYIWRLVFLSTKKEINLFQSNGCSQHCKRDKTNWRRILDEGKKRFRVWIQMVWHVGL